MFISWFFGLFQLLLYNFNLLIWFSHEPLPRHRLTCCGRHRRSGVYCLIKPLKGVPHHDIEPSRYLKRNMVISSSHQSNGISKEVMNSKIPAAFRKHQTPFPTTENQPLGFFEPFDGVNGYFFPKKDPPRN